MKASKVQEMQRKISLRTDCYATALSTGILRCKAMRSVLLLIFAFAFSGLSADLLVIFLKGSKILTSLGEFSFLHTFTDIPVDEGTLGVHEIELVVDTAEGLGDSGRVGNHAARAHDLGKISTWNDSWWLVVDAALEASWAPVNELNGALGLDGGDRGVDVLWHDITTVHQAARHVFTVARIALGKHGSWLEHRVGDLRDGQLLVVSFLSRDDRSVGRKHEVDTWVWHKVGLELGHVDVEGTIETKRGGQRRGDLADDPVKVRVRRALDVEASAAQVVDGFVVKAEVDIAVLKKGMATEDVVVWLNDGGCDLRSRRDGEGKLRLFAVVDRKALKKECTKTRSGTTTSGVVDKEALKTSAVISELADPVEDEVNNLLSDGVVTTGVVVGGIFLSGDQLLRVVELAVGTSANLVNDGWLKVNVDAARDVLSSTSLGEEGVESVVASADGLVGRHLAVRLDTVLKAEEFPGGVTDLATGLSNVDVDNFTHVVEKVSFRVEAKVKSFSRAERSFFGCAKLALVLNRRSCAMTVAMECVVGG